MKPVDVRVGMSLDRISEVTPREAGWTADFHIWFRWTGDAVNPGKNFQIANGRILEREQVITHVTNGERYEQYRVTARMIHYFEAARFPLSDETMSILVEDAVDGVEKLRYVADERSADIRRLALPVGAFFAAVSNNIFVATLLPPAERVTLVQMINAISIATIFLTLVQSAISLYLMDSMGRDRFSRVFDRVSFVVLGFGYAGLNLILPLAARS